MNLLVSFYDKPRNANKELVIEIAKRNNYAINDGRYTVLFNEITQDFIQLIDRCKGSGTSKLYIDNEEFKIQDAYQIFSCYKKPYCDGLCMMLGIGAFYKLKDFFHNMTRSDGELIGSILETTRSPESYDWKNWDVLVSCQLNF